MKISLYYFLAFVSLSSCSKDENKKTKFSWAKKGNKLYYDYHTPTNVIKDSRRLSINERFEEQILSSTPNEPGYLYFNLLSSNIVVKKGGLYGQSVENCGWGIINNNTPFEFLYTPNEPQLHQEIIEYGCSRKPLTKNHIINIDTTVTVPKGTFKTYIMRYENGDKSYWNADEGLIMYERYWQGRREGTLKLTKIQTF
ncbi:hypothetical protein [Hymenobacter swuensis]|uniref:hypothetical protein n=1 Tax=Hymenobacter swuensis TaxID=1446467 RepID=UPI0018CC0C3B|nr:hypothetical protein [Hymenobacter swuensis]